MFINVRRNRTEAGDYNDLKDAQISLSQKIWWISSYGLAGITDT